MAFQLGESTNIAISFSGCGFLSSYHFGVSLCFKKHAQALLTKTRYFAGSSAGALVSTLLIFSPFSLNDGLNHLLNLASDVNSKKFGALTPGFNLIEKLSSIVDTYVPDDISPAQGRLFISVTRTKDGSNELFSSYKNRQHLIDCLKASCFVPVYSNGLSKPPEIDDEAYIDGAYSNNLPIFEGIPTISISPFSGSALISPIDRNMFDWKMSIGHQTINVNLQNVIRGAHCLFPPKKDVLLSYYDMGYRDAMKFLISNGVFEHESGTEV